jgi:predicted transcriptional regulator
MPEPIIGAKIKKIRPMTKAEMSAEMWDDFRGAPVVLELDNGTKLYASQDDEGNGPGAIFGTTKEGQQIGLCLQ